MKFKKGDLVRSLGKTSQYYGVGVVTGLTRYSATVSFPNGVTDKFLLTILENVNG